MNRRALAVLAGGFLLLTGQLQAGANRCVTDREDVHDLGDGMNFSAQHVLPDQMATDLPATAHKIDTAFFVIQGQDDVVTPTKAAIEKA